MVVTDLPSAVPTVVRQERVASPSMWMVQAPQTPGAAAELGARESDLVAQVPEQRRVRVAAESAFLSVHGNGWHELVLPIGGS